jgi:hypothetical protein
VAGATARRLANRELRQPTLFLHSFDSRKLRPDQRTMDRSLFDFDRFGRPLLARTVWSLVRRRNWRPCGGRDRLLQPGFLRSFGRSTFGVEVVGSER